MKRPGEQNAGPLSLTKLRQDPCCNGVQALLAGHKGLVKAVKFPGRRGGSAHSYLLTGGDDKTIRVWRIEDELEQSTCVQKVEAHKAAINCINSTEASSAAIFIASAAADATINVWTFDPKSPTNTLLALVQAIETIPKFFALSLSMSELGQGKGSYLLAAGGTRNTIHIFIGDTVTSPTVPDSECTAPAVLFTQAAVLSGHEGWIRSLDITPQDSSCPSSDLLLASASQDKYIRLWRIHAGYHLATPSARAELTSAGGASRSPANKAHRITSKGAGEHVITFEALLLGHEDWVYSARWYSLAAPLSSSMHGHGQNRAERGLKLQLLSTSADNSLAIWEADPESGVWLSSVRLGEISREKGATTATGSTGGFWTGLWSPDGNAVVTLGRTGGWRMWRRATTTSPSSLSSSSSSSSSVTEEWAQDVAVTGHVKAVMGLSWEKEGRYLLSTSQDQTTRLHSRCKTGQGKGTWHEMARPQIHGYDINCIATLSPTRYVSGADEKLLRVFQMPRTVADHLDWVSDAKIMSSYSTSTNDGDVGAAAQLPEAANMPVLGLSNKVIMPEETSSANVPGISETRALSSSFCKPKTGDRADVTLHPPHEDHLSRHTLFPEIEKLYGHGYELSTCAANARGTLVASACKATSSEHAVIRLFETRRWTEVKPPLKMHGLTCTRVRFAPCFSSSWSSSLSSSSSSPPSLPRPIDGTGGRRESAGDGGVVEEEMLLTVGRDRAWGVFSRNLASQDGGRNSSSGGGSSHHEQQQQQQQQQQQHQKQAQAHFELKFSNTKAHSRMILDCAWAPSGRSFVTAGRDKNVKLWRLLVPNMGAADGGGSCGTGDGGEVSSRTILTTTSPVTAVDFLPLVLGLHTTKLSVLAVGTEAGKIGIYVGSEDGEKMFREEKVKVDER